MGVMNVSGPYLKSRNITLPSLPIANLLRRDEDLDDEDDLDFEDDEDDLETAREFAERSFVADDALLVKRRSGALEDDEDDDEEELASVLDEVAEEAAETDEDAAMEEDGDEVEQPGVQTVGVGGGGESDDMMSFFDEAADAGAGAIALWRSDLPDVSMEELLAEARPAAPTQPPPRRTAPRRRRDPRGVREHRPRQPCLAPRPHLAVHRLGFAAPARVEHHQPVACVQRRDARSAL